MSVPTELCDEARGKDLEAKECGVTVRRLSVIEAKELARPDQKGVLIGGVRSGGPADQAKKAKTPEKQSDAQEKP